MEHYKGSGVYLRKQIPEAMKITVEEQIQQHLTISSASLEVVQRS